MAGFERDLTEKEQLAEDIFLKQAAIQGYEYYLEPHNVDHEISTIQKHRERLDAQEKYLRTLHMNASTQLPKCKQELEELKRKFVGVTRGQSFRITVLENLMIKMLKKKGVCDEELEDAAHSVSQLCALLLRLTVMENKEKGAYDDSERLIKQ